MIFGGTNWGNLGHPGGYTSYDYGSVIKEDRTVTREKYSELKLQVTFLQSSPDYLTAVPGNSSTSLYSDNPDITVTPMLSNSTDHASFFVIRHTNYTSLASTKYRVTLPTSQGDLTVPQTNQSLSLNGRDSKIMVTDYDVQGTRLLYSTADVFTHAKVDNQTVLILYAGAGEYNEFAIEAPNAAVKSLQGGSSYSVVGNNSSSLTVIGWTAKPEESILQVTEGLVVYLLDRNTAYNYWLTDIDNTDSKLIINGPYLVRSASISNDELHIKADFNASTKVEIVGIPAGTTKLFVNGAETETQASTLGKLADLSINAPSFNTPALSELEWKYIDSLPELQEGYDDSSWTVADKITTDNTFQRLITPVSTYSSDYGFHTGVLVYRGHFNATGREANFSVWTQGGSGFASSVWLDDHLLSSFTGNAANSSAKVKYDVTGVTLEASTEHVLTVVVENMGLDEDYNVADDTMKAPRGILGWRLETSQSTDTPITWKLTGNLGGEDYIDQIRGPLNEGGLFIERQGYHLPGAPTDSWESHSPLEGLGLPGIAFYATSFDLDLPSDEWDIPLAFSFSNDTASSGIYRAQLYVNGWQFGKLSSNIGPQTVFPVPEGILNYHGSNYVGISLWALEEGGAKIPGLELVPGVPVWTGREKVTLVDSPTWTQREGAY